MRRKYLRANDYGRGNFPGNKQGIQHTCHTCHGQVHPWCMGKEDIGEGLSDGSICAKCNGGQYSTKARIFSGVVPHPLRSLDLRFVLFSTVFSHHFDQYRYQLNYVTSRYTPRQCETLAWQVHFQFHNFNYTYCQPQLSS